MSEAYKKEERKIADAAADECPLCETANELEASSGEERGHDLTGGKCCPRCGSSCPEGADICEACGEWLLEGQCKFCYAPLEEGDEFCGECGNPVDGIECPRCHNLSYFDFCQHCDIPLTEQAEQVIEELRSSEELGALIEALEHEDQPAGTTGEQGHAELIREHTPRQQRPETRRTPATLFSKGGMSEVDAKIQQVQQVATPQPKKARRTAPHALERIQQKTFANNQEARRFSGALKVLLPAVVKKRVSVTVGWLCNEYQVLHPEGPQGCCAAHCGGRWIYEEYEREEKGFREVEI